MFVALAVAILLALPLSLLLSPSAEILPPPVPAGVTYTSHQRFSIIGNAQFNNTLFPLNGVVSGNGTASDPYIIEGWDIDSSGDTAIRIMFTDAHYVLRNCYIHGNGMFWGIYQLKSVNSTICNNTFSGNSDGIIVDQSSNNTVSDNNFSSNGRGIYLVQTCTNIIVSNNTFNGNSAGINLQASYGNILTDNDLNDDIGIYLFGSSYHNTVRNNNCSSNGDMGIIIQGSSGNTVTDNNFSHNGYFGIYISQGSSYNNISWNKVFNNGDRGIYIQTGSYNRIWNNTFAGNYGGGVQANDAGTNNWWNTSGSPHGYGNRWSDLTTPDANSDGIVDWSYNLTGSAGAKDYYPLTTPPVMIPEFGVMQFVVVVLLVATMLIGEARRRKAS